MVNFTPRGLVYVSVVKSTSHSFCVIFFYLEQINESRRTLLIQMLLVFRFVDFFIIVRKPQELLYNNVKHILHVFNNSSEGLKFTWESLTNNCIQFLGIRLIFSVCWQYMPRSSKNTLPHESAHSKLIKRSVVTNCMQSAFIKSCEHLKSDSFNQQVNRLERAGFPRDLISNV